ncbi:10443_t:CDS:10, partial [Ambispora leptoticha]
MAHVTSPSSVKEGTHFPVSSQKNRTSIKLNRTSHAGDILNKEEVDPLKETKRSYVDDVHEPSRKLHKSKHKQPVSSTTTTTPDNNNSLVTPLVFKSVNPGQNYSQVDPLQSPERHASIPSSSTISSNSACSTSCTPQLSEEQVAKIIEMLGEALEEVKEVKGGKEGKVEKGWEDQLMRVREKGDQLICDRVKGKEDQLMHYWEFNKLLNETPLPNPSAVKPQHIKNLSQLKSQLFGLQPNIHSSPDTNFYKHVFNFYCQMTAFLTVAQMFFEVVVNDFLFEVKQPNGDTLTDFMRIFQDEDNFLIYRFIPASPITFSATTPNYDELDAFIWYYRLIKDSLVYPCDLSQRLHAIAIRFTTLDAIESILSIFYTKYFLNVFAKEHQKDHGQFYTPREVMKFMWNRVLHSRDRDHRNQSFLDKLLRGPPQSFDSAPHPSRHKPGFLPHAPRVLDPCMGIGSFLCEYINRLTFAANQLSSVWKHPEALSHLLQSLTSNLWGIEIDAFACHLSKLNILLHMLPIYKQFLHLSPFGTIKLRRLNLFCNDTLNLYLPKPSLTWEYENLLLLRSPEQLKFDYIVTNPPYMIRKTGFISEPDSELFDERVLGKGGMQAYAYFFWFCVERCKEEQGEVCLISASQWMGLEFADKLRAWMWQRCHLVEFFQFEPFKVWRKIQTDSLIFRLRRRRECISASNQTAPAQPSSSANLEPYILFLRYMNRKATLHETLQAYANFDPYIDTSFDKDMDYKLTPPYPDTILPSSTNSYSFTFLMPTSIVSAYLHSITAKLPSLCDHSSLKSTWSVQNPLIWHRGPNTNPVYALVVRTAWAYSKFGAEVCDKWLRPVFYWNGKNGGKEAEFWSEMGDELRLEKKESSPAEAYVPLLGNSAAAASIKDKQDYEKSIYSLIMVDRDAVEKVRKEGEDTPFWIYLKAARAHLQAGMNSREIVYCGTSKCGVDVKTKIIHPINYGYFSKNQPRQRFFIDENYVCVTNQCIYFTLKTTTQLPSYFFLGLLNSTTIQHFLSHHCKYDQQGRMRLFRESMAKIPYAPPDDSDGAEWFSRCVVKMIYVRKMLFEGIRLCDDEDKVSSAVVEKLRRGSWQLTGREWQEKEKDGEGDETSVVLREEQEGNWVMVKKCRGRGDGVEYSLYPEVVPRPMELDDHSVSSTSLGRQSHHHHSTITTVDIDMLNGVQHSRHYQHQLPARGSNNSNSGNRYNTNKTRIMKPFFESLLHASACLQYAIDQYVYSLYGIDTDFQIALEGDLKLEIFEVITTTYPRWTSSSSTSGTSSPTSTDSNIMIHNHAGKVPEWGGSLIREVEQAIHVGESLLRHKGVNISTST